MTNKHSLEAMAQRIKQVPDYRHKSAAMLAEALGDCSERQMLRWIRALIDKGLIEPRSLITYDGLMTVRRIQRYLDQNQGTVYIGMLAKEVYGAGNNYSWLRWLIEKAVAEGFGLDVSRISSETIPKQLRVKRREVEGKPRFVNMADVDADHRHAWIALMQSWYHLKPRQEVSHAA
ncbi:hypothetical protein QMX34_003007 [Aeromonas hydrophila]|nr:hypothetical protein [Aeromonas hydrophila]